MLTLTLQTSDRNNAVAIFDGSDCLVQTDYRDFLKRLDGLSNDGSDVQPPGGSVQPPGGSTLLLPMVKFCLQEVSVTPQSLNLIAVTQGPGMFTPLRVGVVAAKTMAYVHNIPLVGVDVLESLALAAARRRQPPMEASKANNGNAANESNEANKAVVESAVNAQRKQLFVAKFEVNEIGTVVRKTDSRLVVADQWADEIKSGSTVTGPGLKIVSDTAMQRMKSREGVVVEQDEYWQCDIKSVAEIGQHRFSTGGIDETWSLTPIYFRPSAAEEVRTGS